MSATDGWTGCASIAASDLPALADQRRAAGIRVVVDGTRAWVAWECAAVPILERVRSLRGAEIYERRDGLWFRAGCRLPTFGVPLEHAEGVPLSRAIVPGQFRPVAAGNTERPRPLPLQLVPEHFPRATSALSCSLDALTAWAESAMSGSLGNLQAAYSDNHVFLIGQRLPALAQAKRYWGRELLVPLGLRPEPSLSEAALRAALRVEPGTLLIVDHDGHETIPLSAFGPLTRAGIRVARQREDGGA